MESSSPQKTAFVLNSQKPTSSSIPIRVGAPSRTGMSIFQKNVIWGAVTLQSDAISGAIRAKALALGFDACGVADVRAPWEASARLEEFLHLGRHGDMTWLSSPVYEGGAERSEAEGGAAASPLSHAARDSSPVNGGANRRAHPLNLWPEAKSAIMLGQSYAPSDDSMALLEERSRGLVSAYAARRDYHEVIKGKLKNLAHWIARESQGEVKVFVDTAPLMEKPLAQRAGLGWQGKHTNLVSRAHGSWLFLGAILTSAELKADAAEQDHCGSCSACLDVCPTKAFPAPYQLDARRCLAYWSIEHKGQIPVEFRAPMGNRVFGCDDCLSVCPWNKFAESAREARLAGNAAIRAAPLGELAVLDDAAFRTMFAGTPVKRTGRDRFIRNVVCAIGNSGSPSLIPVVLGRLDDASPLVRGMAVWALQQYAEAGLLDPQQLARLKLERAPGEADPDVRREWGVREEWGV
jgi:epoxyqueuosine reductase